MAETSIAFKNATNGISAVSSSSPLPVTNGSVQGLPSNYAPIGAINTGPNNLVQYIGYAPVGTAESAASWAIALIGYDSNNVWNRTTWASVTNAQQAINLIFNNYASYTYS